MVVPRISRMILSALKNRKISKKTAGENREQFPPVGDNCDVMAFPSEIDQRVWCFNIVKGSEINLFSLSGGSVVLTKPKSKILKCRYSSILPFIAGVRISGRGGGRGPRKCNVGPGVVGISYSFWQGVVGISYSFWQGVGTGPKPRVCFYLIC